MKGTILGEPSTLLHTGKLLAIQVFLKGPREMEITVHEIGVIGVPVFITSQAQPLSLSHVRLAALGPSDFHLFRPLKVYVTNKQFATDANMKQAVTSRVQTLDTKSLLE